MAIMVKWHGRLRRGRAEDGKLWFHLEWPKARQTRFIVSHQHLLPLRPAASTVIIAFQAMAHPLLIAVVPWICRVYIAYASNE